MTDDIEGKRLDLLSRVVPKGTRIAYLVNPDNPAAVRIAQSLNASVEKTGKGLLLIQTRTMQEVEEGISLMVKQRVGGFLVADDGFLNNQAAEIAALAARHKLPSCFGVGRGPDNGGLMSFGVIYADVFRRAATYVDKILKGAKPGDLPIEQSSTFEFVINRKTAKALRLTIPQELLLRADRVVE